MDRQWQQEAKPRRPWPFNLEKSRQNRRVDLIKCLLTGSSLSHRDLPPLHCTVNVCKYYSDY